MSLSTRRFRLGRRFASLVVLASIALVAALVPASPASADGIAVFKNGGENQPYCLKTYGASAQNYLFLDKSCNNAWSYESKWGNSSFQIRLSGTSLCVDIPNSNHAIGTHLWLWPCNGTMAQRWYWTYSCCLEWHYITAWSSGLRLEERYGGSGWGWVSLGYPYSPGGWNQVWSANPGSGGGWWWP